MGQFSWIYSDSKEQLLDDVEHDTYLLVPPKFQDKYGEYIYEPCYEGYGEFGGYDVFELIAEWNREFIPQMIELIDKGKWKCGTFCQKDILLKYYNGEHLDKDDVREVGIEMACYDEDNERLPYPIKIVEDKDIFSYERIKPSMVDPDQGWKEEYLDRDYGFDEESFDKMRDDMLLDGLL